MRYSVWRHFFRPWLRPVMIFSGLTLDEALRVMDSRESSVYTAAGDTAKMVTDTLGPWEVLVHNGTSSDSAVVPL